LQLKLGTTAAVHLRTQVIYELLGIPFSDYKMLSGNVAVRASASSTARDAAAAQSDLTAYMERLVGGGAGPWACPPGWVLCGAWAVVATL
jgi:hypothetical protein